jgi:serine/threonine protein kinase
MSDPEVPREETAAANPQPGVDESTGDPLRPGPGLTPTDTPEQIGRFEIRRLLGEGAFGRVYHAFDPQLTRDVAIKVPHRARLTPEFRERFLREARAAATIHHPNVCPVYEVGTEDDLPYIVMHFVHGPTLQGWLARSSVPLRDALKITGKLALGMAAAHAKGVIHRDLKPQNVLVDEENRQVLITDFGLARIGDEAEMTAEGQAMGTPAYMAPEQARGSQTEVGPLCDVYSLGVILYRLTTGEMPFQGVGIGVLWQAQFEEARAPSTVRPGIDPAVDALCLKAMAKNPADRFQSAKEFAAALADYMRAGERAAGEGPGDSPRSDSHLAAKPVGDGGAGNSGTAPIPKRPTGPDPDATPRGGSTSGPLELVEESQPPLPSPAGKPKWRPAPPRPATPVNPPAAGMPVWPGEPAAPATPVVNRESTGGRGNEGLVCPKCHIRIQAEPGQANPVACPLCDSRLPIMTGPQATRSSVLRTGLDPDGKSSQRTTRRGPDAEDDDGGAPAGRAAWLLVACGLRLSWLGMLLSVGFLVATLVITIASAGRPPDPWLSAILGVGQGLGLILVGFGRRRAARLPVGVVGGRLARTSGAAAYWAVACLLPPFLLVSSLPPEPGAENRLDGVLMSYALVSAGLGVLVLLVGEFAFNRYLTAIARHLGPDFPRGLTRTTRIVLQNIVCFALVAGIAVRISNSAGSELLRSALTIAAGLSACLALVLLWGWLLMNVWLNIRASAEVRRYAHAQTGDDGSV